MLFQVVSASTGKDVLGVAIEADLLAVMLPDLTKDGEAIIVTRFEE